MPVLPLPEAVAEVSEEDITESRTTVLPLAISVVALTITLEIARHRP